MPPPVASMPPPARARAPLLAIAIVAVVAILVLATVLVFVVLAPSRPVVRLGVPYAPSDQAFVVNVTSVTPPIERGNLRVSLTGNGASAPPSPLAPSPYPPDTYFVWLNLSGDAYQALWVDQDNDTRLSAGDALGVARFNGAITATIVLQVRWVDGTVLASAAFTPPSAPSPPVVALSASEPVGTNGFRFTIAGVSQSRAISNFRVNFLVESTTSTEGAGTLAASLTFTVGGTTYTVAYTDLGGEGSLTGGDFFTVTKAASDLTPGTTYNVLLLWSDGSLLADGAYTA